MSEKRQVKRRSLAERVIALVEEARKKVAGVANVALVYTYYETGRMIVEEEQGGKRRAEYGKELLKDLSRRLTDRFGKGWSVDNLERMRTFFLLYSKIHNTVVEIDTSNCLNTIETISETPSHKSTAAIPQTPFEESPEQQIRNGVAEIDSANSVNSVYPIPRFVLSWSHYLVLMRIGDPEERAFYEKEAAEGHWSLAQLSRQIGSQLYERSLKHKGKTGVKDLMWKAPRPDIAEEPLKDPYTLEFLGLPERTEYSESQLEQAIIDHLQEFMLELGKGFTFVGRQVRFTFEEEHYRADLVFYNRLTRSFFVFDLKLGKITHQDIGQMQMYVHYYDRVVRLPDENPTIGILLSSEKVNEATVKLTLPECEHNRIFARQYKTVMPKVSSLKRIVLSESRKFEKLGIVRRRK